MGGSHVRTDRQNDPGDRCFEGHRSRDRRGAGGGRRACGGAFRQRPSRRRGCHCRHSARTREADRRRSRRSGRSRPALAGGGWLARPDRCSRQQCRGDATGRRNQRQRRCLGQGVGRGAPGECAGPGPADAPCRAALPRSAWRHSDHSVELGCPARPRKPGPHRLCGIEGRNPLGHQGNRPQLRQRQYPRLRHRAGRRVTRLSEQASAATGGEAAVSATLAMGEWVPRPISAA